jgi:hypothetical protein
VNANEGVDQAAFNPILSGFERALFFTLGFAPVFSWNCAFVSEAYFYGALGPAVLSRLGLCQNMASLVSQTVLLFVRKKVVAYRLLVSVSLAYMALYCVFFVVVPVAQLRPWHLYAAQTLNGIATGVAQTQLGNMGGLYGGAGRVGTVLFAGNSLGALLPPLLQFAMLLLHGSMGDAAAQSQYERNAAVIIFAIGAAGSLFGVAAINALARTDNYKALTETRCLICNEDFLTLGSDEHIAKQRWAVSTVRVCQGLIVFTRGVWLFTLAISPYMPAQGHYWTHNLATLLIVSASFGDFAGRAVANRYEWVIQNVRMLTAGSVFRILFAVYAVLYINLPEVAASGNFVALAMFFVMSFTHGYIVCCSNVRSSTSCNFFPGEDSCPLVSQLSWMSSQIGLVAGIALSFVPVR